MKQVLGSIIAAMVLLATPAYAQGTAADTDMQVLRDKIRTDKKALVAANMQLSDAEARVFWPVYDQYQVELGVINERLARGIANYADAYNAGPLQDSIARRFLDEAITIDEMEVRLRRGYAARLTRLIPAAKAARYMQIEAKIRAAIRYELAENIPLVE